MSEQCVLVINTGSSSLKIGIYSQAEGEERILLDGLAEAIGKDSGTLTLKDAAGKLLRSEDRRFASEEEALDVIAGWLEEQDVGKLAAIGHRVVHGGPHLLTHQALTPAVLEQLRACVHFAPLHIPLALALIERSQRTYPGTPQFACFDTAFHSTMPEVATHLPLPQSLFDEGIRRYGFHGLSYESVVAELGAGLPSRTVIAHLGSGASLAAVLDGRSIDTSMGLTPTGGIPMATRSGDLDPGVLLYLLRRDGATADSLEIMLNHSSGLSALSGGKSDMRDLEEAAAAADGPARLAIEIFCRSIAKQIAAYASVLGGLDLLVFSGGIGEHSDLVREMVSSRLGFLGLKLDDGANQAHQSVLSSSESSAQIRIVPSQEDLQIAYHARALLALTPLP